jgi:hypothetical protein
MARDDEMAGRRSGARLAAQWPQLPREHVITRLYVLPAGSATEFTAELEDETEVPTAELRALFRDRSG